MQQRLTMVCVCVGLGGWGVVVCVCRCMCVRIKRPLFFFVYRETMKPYILSFVLGEVEDKITGLCSSIL